MSIVGLRSAKLIVRLAGAKRPVRKILQLPAPALIVAETGWAMTTVFLGFSVALIVMGFISTWVGRLIDRIGAGAGMSHPFLEGVAADLYERAMATLRYEFPYIGAGARGRP